MLKTIVTLLVITLFAACSGGKPDVQKANRAPVIESITYAKDSMAKMDNDIVCRASDADGDSLEYQWSDSMGNSIGKGPAILWVSPDTMGNYSVTLKVSDTKGGEASQVFDIRVLNNADGSSAAPVNLLIKLPSDKIVADNRTVKVGTVTRVNCNLDNIDSKKLTYTWNVSGGNIKGEGKKEPRGTAFWTAPPATGLYDVTVDINDEEGHTARGLVTFDVFCCPRN
jgi:hypothetical protein